MKKRLILCLVLSMSVILSSCGVQKSSIKETTKTEDNKSDENEKDLTEADAGAEDMEEDQGDNDTPRDVVNISIYYPDPETGELAAHIIEVEQVDAKIIWRELQKVNVVEESSEVLGVEIGSDGDNMTLDLNKAFGDQLRSMGTTGESETLYSIVNTYLDAFECQKIKITEEGRTLTSGHKEYEEYLGKK